MSRLLVLAVSIVLVLVVVSLVASALDTILEPVRAALP